MKAPTRKAGRPRAVAGEGELKRLSVYGDEQDLERVRLLAEKWRCSRAAAVRQAVALAAQREGVESPGRRPNLPATETDEERRRRVYAAAGKFAHVPFSSDDLTRERQQQALFEKERDRRRWEGAPPTRRKRR